MDKSSKHFKFTMVFLAPVVTLFFFSSFFFFVLEHYLFMVLNFFVFLCILTYFSFTWNRFMDQFTSEVKMVADAADSVNCSAQMLDREVKHLMSLQTKIDTPGNQKLMELLNYSRQEAEKGGPVGLAHLKMARELVTICSEFNTPLKKESSEAPLVMIDCILLNSDKIKSQIAALEDNFNRPNVKKIKLKRRDFFARKVIA